ncbi:hypothetical protein BMS3Abin02_00478 [bacterium BMS3Abin02]|nr:hypothetical protein BMS3Abin02_00478 [bacterium BMS3Abin02]
MGELRIRQAVRGLVIDEDDRVLLVHFEFPYRSLWHSPGGGIEPGESHHEALGRELAEEAGLVGAEIGPHIWTRRHIFPFLDGSHDGQEEACYLVRTRAFEPAPQMTWEELRAEFVDDVRWWTLSEMAASSEMFAPNDLPRLVAEIITNGPSVAPLTVGI